MTEVLVLSMDEAAAHVGVAKATLYEMLARDELVAWTGPLFRIWPTRSDLLAIAELKSKIERAVREEAAAAERSDDLRAILSRPVIRRTGRHVSRARQRRLIAAGLRDAGMTFRQIGQALGVGTERARDLANIGQQLKRNRENLSRSVDAEGAVLCDAVGVTRALAIANEISRA